MLHALPTTPSSSAASNSSSFAARKVAQPQPATPLSSMSPSSHLDASAVLIVPIYDEMHEGADLLMIPISDNKNSSHKQRPSSSSKASFSSSSSSPQQPTSARRTETPAAPTPPPKPRLPEGCDDWDSYLSQKKSTATLPHYDNDNDDDDDNFLPHELEPLPEHQPQHQHQHTRHQPQHQHTQTQPEAGAPEPPRLQSPELNFKHSFEHLGWRDCLAQSTRQRAHARALRRRPSAATVIGLNTGYYPPSTSASYYCQQPDLAASSAVSLRAAKRLSNASTLTVNTVNTVATAPCVLTRGYSGANAAKRLSAASTLTTASMGSLLSTASTSTMGGKPRSLRRIHRTRHLRAYYSDGAASLRRRLSVGISSLRDIAERREPATTADLAAAVSLLGKNARPGQPAVASSGASTKSCNRKSTATTATAASRRRRLSSVSTLTGELSAPPPYPPPEKPLPSLPSLPVVEVRELQTGERARWREMLLRSFQRRGEGAVGRRRAASPWRGWTPRVVEAAS